MKDPLDGIEQPTLAEQIEPYLKYGNSELAISLLHFQKCESVGVPSLGSDHGTFEVLSQPANVKETFHCPDCKENVRGVTVPDRGVCLCPLCGEQPGLLALGEGPK